MLLQQFQANFKRDSSFLNSAKFLLAVSGGIDSVVMTDLFFKSGLDFVIAHCNFNLRDEESLRDEAFVQSLAASYNKEFFLKKFDTRAFADKQKISIQEAARALRYEWFKELLAQFSTEKKYFLSTAHNADDNVETALMFFLRGTGINGLTGIADYDKERKIIRPLLFASRKDIAAYAGENNISWVEDSSNAADKYARNFLRLSLIPSAEKIFPSVKHNLENNINRFKEISVLYNQAIESHKKKLLEFFGDEVQIPLLKLQQAKPLNTIIFEIFKAYNFQPHQVEEIKKLFHAGNSSFIQSSTHKIIKNRNRLIIAAHETKTTTFILINEEDKKMDFEAGTLSVEVMPANSFQPSANSFIAQLDAAHITFPLLLRKWKQGDYFYPLGMRKKKKLSRFFIDQKFSATQKQKTWVLESDKKIIWVVGCRIDERFKLTSSTKKIIAISLTVKN